MKIRSLADVKAHLSEYVREAERGPVVITRNGRPAAVLLAVDDQRLCAILGYEVGSSSRTGPIRPDEAAASEASTATAPGTPAPARSPDEGVPAIPDYLL